MSAGAIATNQQGVPGKGQRISRRDSLGQIAAVVTAPFATGIAAALASAPKPAQAQNFNFYGGFNSGYFPAYNALGNFGSSSPFYYGAYGPYGGLNRLNSANQLGPLYSLYSLAFATNFFRPGYFIGTARNSPTQIPFVFPNIGLPFGVRASYYQAPGYHAPQNFYYRQNQANNDQAFAKQSILLPQLNPAEKKLQEDFYVAVAKDLLAPDIGYTQERIAGGTTNLHYYLSRIIMANDIYSEKGLKTIAAELGKGNPDYIREYGSQEFFEHALFATRRHEALYFAGKEAESKINDDTKMVYEQLLKERHESVANERKILKQAAFITKIYHQLIDINPGQQDTSNFEDLDQQIKVAFSAVVKRELSAKMRDTMTLQERLYAKALTGISKDHFFLAISDLDDKHAPEKQRARSAALETIESDLIAAEKKLQAHR